MSEYHLIEYQQSTPESRQKLLHYLQLNRSWWRPSSLEGNMTGVYWNTEYQRRKALEQLVKDGHVECKLFERGHFRYYAYRAIETITLEQYRAKEGK